jgi:hypothetical protein
MFGARRRPHVLLAAGAVWLAAAIPTTVAGQTVYKWVDENGVVHFADTPPTGKQEYEERSIAPAPVTRRQTTTGDVPDTADALPAAPAPEGAAAAARGSGPARVILTSQSALPRGTDARHVVGIVKNVGGESAANVRVTAHIADAQRNPCQNEDIDVVPSTLGPGESGNFDATLTSPCFLEEGSVDAEAVWD